MSLSIAYPFTQYAKLFHSLGFKFVEAERKWVGYELTRKKVAPTLPEEVRGWLSDYLSFHDSLIRMKAKGTIVDETYQDPKYVSWMALSESDSLQASYRAEEESEQRKQLLLQVKMDFAHPRLRIQQGGSGIYKENNCVYIKGSLYTYHKEGLNSVFHELSHFITLSPERLKSDKIELSWSKQPKTFQGTLNELKVIALTEVLSEFYQVEKTNRKGFIEAIADYPDSDLFFNAHMHLVSKFSTYTEEDKQEDRISYKWFVEKEGLTPEEAQKQVQKIASEILHRRHKIQVLSAFFDKQLSGKYTMEHVKFMFSQQLPYL